MVVYRATPADKLRTNACAYEARFAYFRYGKPYGYGNFFKVHADERVADVHSRVRFYFFRDYGFGESRIRYGGERPARFFLRNDVHAFGIRYCGAFGDDRAVMVFASLHGKVYAERL